MYGFSDIRNPDGIVVFGENLPLLFNNREYDLEESAKLVPTGNLINLRFPGSRRDSIFRGVYLSNWMNQIFHGTQFIWGPGTNMYSSLLGNYNQWIYIHSTSDKIYIFNTSGVPNNQKYKVGYVHQIDSFIESSGGYGMKIWDNNRKLIYDSNVENILTNSSFNYLRVGDRITIDSDSLVCINSTKHSKWTTDTSGNQKNSTTIVTMPSLLRIGTGNIYEVSMIRYISRRVNYRSNYAYYVGDWNLWPNDVRYDPITGLNQQGNTHSGMPGVPSNTELMEIIIA